MPVENDLLTAGQVLELVADDAEMHSAISRSVKEWSDFTRAFHQPALRRNGFLAVAVRRENDRLVPVGVRVEKIAGDRIIGKRVENRLVETIDRPMEISLSNVIDWRYIDTLECEGGTLYRLLLSRQIPMFQGKIEDHQAFIIEREEEYDREFRRLMRDIANLRYNEVEQCLDQHPEWASRWMKMPFFFHQFRQRKVALYPQTPGSYGAAFGDRRMMELLNRLGALNYKSETVLGPLFAACHVGNEETTRYLCEQGYDTNARDFDGVPLLHSVLQQFATPQIVETLVRYGANPNDKDTRDQNAAFLVLDRDVARELIRSDVDLGTVNKNGESCTQKQLRFGNRDIARLFMEHGAPRVKNPSLYPNEFDLSRGRKVLEDYMSKQSDEAYQRYKHLTEMDYGHVLPIPYIDLQRRNQTKNRKSNSSD